MKTEEEDRLRGRKGFEMKVEKQLRDRKKKTGEQINRMKEEERDGERKRIRVMKSK